MLVVRGDENDVRKLVAGRLDRVERREAVEARHLDVEEHDVGPRPLDRRDGFATGRRFARDLDIAGCLEKPAHLGARRRFVVNDQRAQASGMAMRRRRRERPRGKEDRHDETMSPRSSVTIDAAVP